MGPFEYKGIIIDNDNCDPASWNNHGSIECVNGQWYVFYHRCSQGVQQHRRLCIEKIQILPDGTIPEVKMTSQGIGDPFTPGEAINGYQACEMHGKCFIGLNADENTREEYPELLTNITAGDEIIFRYIKSDTSWKRARLLCKGKGRIQVELNGKSVGIAEVMVPEGESRAVDTEIEASSGEYEVTLRVVDAEELEILEMTLL